MLHSKSSLKRPRKVLQRFDAIRFSQKTSIIFQKPDKQLFRAKKGSYVMHTPHWKHKSDFVCPFHTVVKEADTVVVLMKPGLDAGVLTTVPAKDPD